MTGLAAELARLSKVDAEHLTATRNIQATARKDLSRGTFPDTAKQRFYEVTIFRVRRGHEGSFAAAAKAYGSAAGRAAPQTSFRVYEVIAGSAVVALVARIVDLEDANPGCNIDSGELIQARRVPGIRSRNFTSSCRR